MLITTMDKLLPLLLEHPERFTPSEIPCCLLGVWDIALSDLPDPYPYPRAPVERAPTPSSDRVGVRLTL